jgi:hypothetical protein
VVHVIVDGEVVVEKGRLVKLDEEALIDEAKSVAASYLRRAGVSSERVWLVGTRRRSSS